MNNLLRDKPSWRWFKAKDVQMVDDLITLAKGRGTTINYSSQKDWEIINQIIKVWSIKFPRELEDYGKFNREFTRSLYKPTGASETNRTRFLGNFPNVLKKMIEVIYPEQKFDTKFFREFTKHNPVFRVAEKI